MQLDGPVRPPLVSRRKFLGAAAAAMAAGTGFISRLAGEEARKNTEFQIACMTLPYSQFPLERALTGIRSAGYEYVAWGTTHRDASGREIPVMPAETPPAQARELGNRCRDLGLKPLMMFSGIYPEHADAVRIFTTRVKQAAAAGVPQVLTFGHTEGGHRELWVRRFKELGPAAADHGVMIVLKQHGGETGTGRACAEIVREIAHPAIQVNYDAGNVMDYLNLDPIPDLQSCAAEVRSLCIKDHRNFPKDEDCGPGFGEIDHYKLLDPLARTGLKMPLFCENISAPLVPRPSAPEGVDRLAARAREFLETVIRGLQS